MRVPSPTRTVGILLATAAAVVAAASPAQARPQGPGSFTGYGFDTCSAPSQKTMDAWNLNSPFTAIGIYVSGNSRYCGDQYQPNLTPTWVSTNSTNGWRFLPIHVGYQSPCFKNNPNSRVQKKHMSTNVNTARSQAHSDALETIAALKRLGFKDANTASFLDLEWYSRTKACDNVVLEFIDEWTETLHENHFMSGVYSSGSAAIKAMDDALAARRSGFNRPDYAWIAWTNGEANVDGGTYLRDSFFTPHRRIHQYLNGKTVSYAGSSVNIDWDWVDIGYGSVPSVEPKPCGVRMSFNTYPTLKAGSTGREVSALQCLLKLRGYSVPVNGSFGSSTTSALNQWASSMGWKPVSRTTPATWTALLSAGPKPRVLKRGSVGESVWRLQRALRAAGDNAPTNGLYDAATVTAVQAYRDANGLTKYQTAEGTVWGLLQRGHTG